jgi:hypothetical protein
MTLSKIASKKEALALKAPAASSLNLFVIQSGVDE